MFLSVSLSLPAPLTLIESNTMSLFSSFNIMRVQDIVTFANICILCIYVLTTLSLSSLSSSRFLLQSLEDLDSSLRKLNSRLFVIQGQPTDVFPRLFKVSSHLNMKLEDTLKHGVVFYSVANVCFLPVLQEWNISRLSYEYDSEPFGKERDAAIKKLACEAGVEVTVRISHTLYDLDK